MLVIFECCVFSSLCCPQVVVKQIDAALTDSVQFNKELHEFYIFFKKIVLG